MMNEPYLEPALLPSMRGERNGELNAHDYLPEHMQKLSPQIIQNVEVVMADVQDQDVQKREKLYHELPSIFLP